MLSTFIGVEIGKRGLVTQMQALVTVGHNLNNAGVEGYSRQRVIMTASDPIYLPGLNRENTKGHIGQGVQVERVERVRDLLLEDQIINRTAYEGYWDTANNYFLMVDKAYNEPTENSVRTLLDKFWESWQNLSTHPSDLAARKVVLERGKALVDGINNMYQKLRGISDMINSDVKLTVEQVNGYIRNIALLNEQIQKAKALGDNPNDLEDKRDLLIEKLGKLVDISVERTDPDELIVYANARMIVQGRIYREFDTRTTTENEGYYDVVWKGTDELVKLNSGKLKALLDMRDLELRSEIQKIDVLAMNFVDLVNSIHRKGFGLNNATGLDFFREVPYILNVQGNYDRNGDGVFDSSYIFRITGSHRLKASDLIGIRGQITVAGAEGPVTIEYYPTDTVAEVIQRINTSGAEISAYLNEEGRLSLKAVPADNFTDPDFVIRHVEDLGEFLVGYSGLLSQSGAAGAYDWQRPDAVSVLASNTQFAVAPLAHPAAWLKVNPEIENNPASIASGFGQDGIPNGPEDGSAARTIADLRVKPVMVGDLLTFDDYFSDLVASIAARGENALKNFQIAGLEMKNLRDLREAISGVNIDEELTEMIKFQHGYNAAARIVTEFDKMLDVIINRMGV